MTDDSFTRFLDAWGVANPPGTVNDGNEDFAASGVYPLPRQAQTIPQAA